MGNFFLPFWFGSWLSGVESLYYLTPWESWAKFPSFLPLSSLPRYFMAPHPFLNSVSSLQFILNLSVIWSFEWNKIWCFATVFVAVKTIRTSFRHFFFSICVLDLSPLLSLVHLLEMQRRAYNRLTFNFKVTV